MREVIGEKITHRLSQQPAIYRVLRYVRPVVKRQDTGALATARMPAPVLERTSADVSLLAGMQDAGIVLSRSTLTNWAGRAIDLMAPIHAAQWRHVLES